MANRYILADFEALKEKNFIAEYFNFKDIDYDFIPPADSTPLVDQLAERIKGKQNVYFIFDPNTTLRRLYLEKSRYNNFLDIGIKHNLILMSKQDGNELFNTLSNIGANDPELANWIDSMAPFVFIEGFAGGFHHNNYKNCKFINLFHPFLEPKYNITHLHGSKKHRPDKDFFCLMIEKQSTRPHRNLLNQKIIDNDLEKNAIYRFGPLTSDTFKDLGSHYQQRLLDLNPNDQGWLDSALPPIHYYNRTNFELVVESNTRHNNDDSFFFTEKTFKPIALKHPFIILSNYNHLRNLHELGFKTFHNHIDESYDSKTDVNDRIDIIVRNLKALENNSSTFYKETKYITEHNYNHIQLLHGRWKLDLWNKLDEFWNNN